MQDVDLCSLGALRVEPEKRVNVGHKLLGLREFFWFLCDMRWMLHYLENGENLLLPLWLLLSCCQQTERPRFLKAVSKLLTLPPYKVSLELITICTSYTWKWQFWSHFPTHLDVDGTIGILATSKISVSCYKVRYFHSMRTPGTTYFFCAYPHWPGDPKTIALYQYRLSRTGAWESDCWGKVLRPQNFMIRRPKVLAHNSYICSLLSGYVSTLRPLSDFRIVPFEHNSLLPQYREGVS